MSEAIQMGARVKRADATEESIPAYRDMRGTIVRVSDDGRRCRVQWDCDRTPGWGWRRVLAFSPAND